MVNMQLIVEMGSQGIAVWGKRSRRTSRVTLLVEVDDKFVVIRDLSRGVWFLPGGKMKKNESIEETAKREALEELGLEIMPKKVIKTFHVTLISRDTGEKHEIHPFISVYSTKIGGTLRERYSPNKRVFLVGKCDVLDLLQQCKVPDKGESEGMKPYVTVSIETLQQFLSS